MNDALNPGRVVMIVCAVVAAVCTTAGSWIKIRRGDSVRLLATALHYSGYFFFGVSIVLFILLGLAGCGGLI